MGLQHLLMRKRTGKVREKTERMLRKIGKKTLWRERKKKQRSKSLSSYVGFTQRENGKTYSDFSLADA